MQTYNRSIVTFDHLFQTDIAPFCTTFRILNRLGFASGQCRKGPNVIKTSAEETGNIGMILHHF